jgi:hypothetical protein
MGLFLKNIDIEVRVESIVNAFDYLMLSSINYDEASMLTVSFEGNSIGAGNQNGSFVFSKPLSFFVLQEAIDAYTYYEE